MRALPIVALFAFVLAVPFTTACYPPRIESCRGATSDFSSVEDVRLIDVHNESSFEISSGSVGYRVEAPGLDATCIAVHSELLREGVLVRTLETTLVMRDVAGVPTSSRLHHYRSGDRVRVTVLGRTIEAPVVEPSRFPDTGVADGGLLPDALPPSDAPLPLDAGLLDDAGIDDAGTEEDAGIDEDAAVEDDAG